MRYTTTLLLCLLVIPAVMPLSAESGANVDLPTRARGAALVVVGATGSEVRETSTDPRLRPPS